MWVGPKGLVTEIITGDCLRGNGKWAGIGGRDAESSGMGFSGKTPGGCISLVDNGNFSSSGKGKLEVALDPGWDIRTFLTEMPSEYLA